jgi:nitrite reductase/ring-hydroxylating ferredoxin subunit
MTDFVDVASLDQLASGTGRLVMIAENAVALFNLDGRLFAIDDACLRCGSSLAAGKLHGAEVACSGCDWRYDVVTGIVAGVPALQSETYEVRVVDAHVMVAVAMKWPTTPP